MAEYLHPGRGVVKPSDPLRQCEHSRVLLVYSLTLLCMLHVSRTFIRSVVKEMEVHVSINSQ